MTTEDPTVPSSSHQALYRRWRAQTFSAIVGQGPVVETIRNAVRLDRLAHGLLFVGPRGTGKTSMARIVAKAINCADPRDGEPCDACEACVSIREGRALDVVELDAASNNRVDDMRELLPRVYTASADLRRKVFIIDEVQRIKEGWDVLLKTLEEPPPDVVFIFCTTNPTQIRPAVVSRLQRFTFRPLTVDEIGGKLERILAEDGRSAEPGAVRLVARLAAGGMRDAESILDQLLSGVDEPLTEGRVRDLMGLAEETAVDAFVQALARPDPLAGISVLDELEAGGRDLVAFSDQVVIRVRELLLERLTDGSGAHPGAPALAAAARRLAGLDSNRAGAGGYRFQLELALLQAADGPTRQATQPGLAESPAPEPAVRAAHPSPSGRPTQPPGTTRGQAQAPEPSPLAVPVGAPEPPASEVPAPEGPAPEAPAPESPAPESPAREGVVPEPPARGPSDVEGHAQPTAPSDDPLGRLRREWALVVAHVGRNPANRPLVAACRPLQIEGRIVVLGFPEDQGFLRDIADRKRPALEEGVQAVLGSDYVVRCVAANVEVMAEAIDEEARQVIEQARRVFAGDLADVAEIS